MQGKQNGHQGRFYILATDRSATKPHCDKSGPPMTKPNLCDNDDQC